MEMNVTQMQGKEMVTVLSLAGDLDASNFEAVIAKAKDIYAAGSRRLLLDMSELEFMSSSGIVALHSITLLLRGEQPHDLEGGWNVFHAIEQDRNSNPGVQPYVKILNPQSGIKRTLEKTGLDAFFEIHTDLQSAVASF